MIEVIVVGEGQTEETFVRKVLAPALETRTIYVQSRLIRTSNAGRGGALTWDRVRLFLRNLLRERHDTYVTTLFDLYGLDSGFPGRTEAARLTDPVDRARRIEVVFAARVVEQAGCRADRFLPHIQPYEFEGCSSPTSLSLPATAGVAGAGAYASATRRWWRLNWLRRSAALR
ncbi:MAG: DUF4276 family protein [Dehalococcoidia bacterium]